MKVETETEDGVNGTNGRVRKLGLMVSEDDDRYVNPWIEAIHSGTANRTIPLKVLADFYTLLFRYEASVAAEDKLRQER